MTTDRERDYLEARVEGAKTLAESYEHYYQSPECFVAGVQYALDRMLARTQDLHNILAIGDVMHAHAIDILNQAKERRL